MTNIMTVDVEEYFHVNAFSKVIPQDSWSSFESRVEACTYRILDLLSSAEGPAPQPPTLPATFFILGWVAERRPALVREIHARGHEVACHGYAHQCVFNQSAEGFREDVRKAKGILEDIIGAEVIGYRAPTYSIIPKTIWALKILFDLGFRYDSSIFPIKHDVYGFHNAPRFPFYIDFTAADTASIMAQLENPRYLRDKGDSNFPESNNLFIELPMSTINLFGRNLPCSGGGYFRLFPYRYTSWSFKKLGANGEAPAIFYIHPWELDPSQPVVKGASTMSKFRHYTNLESNEKKFKRLLGDFSFISVREFLSLNS